MRTTRRVAALAVVAVLAGIALTAALVAQAGTQARSGDEDGPGVHGAGTTMVEGGTGAPSFTPLLTKVAFHARKGSGRFECLALAPSAPAGDPGSGDFDTNVMYVTGEITSAKVRGNVATPHGNGDGDWRRGRLGRAVHGRGGARRAGGYARPRSVGAHIQRDSARGRVPVLSPRGARPPWARSLPLRLAAHVGRAVRISALLTAG